MTYTLFSTLRLAWIAGSRARAGWLFGLGLALMGSAQASTFSASGTTLNIDLDVPSQTLTVVSTGSTYTFTLSNVANITWTGSGTGTAVAGAVLTVTPGTTYDTINLTDSATGVLINFNNSTANAYGDHFNVTLDNAPSALTFNGASSFTGAFGLSITTARRIDFASGSSLSLVNGNLTLDANTQVVPTAMTYSGIMVNNATINTTGSGITTLRARGGNGSALNFTNKGIAVIGGGSITGGTTGTMTIEGRSFAGVDGQVQGQGVFVGGRNSTTLAVSTITSNGADVSVTGYGAENTAPTIAFGAHNTGVVVGAPSPKTDAQYGKITSGGNGAVTVTGYGGTVVAPATPDYVSSNNFLQCSGVFTSGSDAMITSGGAGKVTVSGTGGGPASNNTGSVGVSVYGTANGGILGGPGASVEVTGRGSEAAGSGCRNNDGVSVYQGKIKAGVGAGTTRVTGYGGYPATGTGTSFNYGIRLSTSATITSDGSGSVTVIGNGANAGTNNAGIYAQSLSSISSGGGEVRVEGNGGGSGGSGAGTFCYGISVVTGSFITAGGTGNVTVIGRGGNNLSATAGNSNYGVQITSFGSSQTPGYITSSGGNVTVEGTGGGGSPDSPSGSASTTNYGVFVDRGSYVTAGGSGSVTVTGQGGNRSPGATGNTNIGVLVSDSHTTSTTIPKLFAYISSAGGAVTVNGTGGGPQTGTGSSNSNHGVQVTKGGTITAGGTGTVTVNGTGGSPSSDASGGTNYGVNVDGGTAPDLSKITSNNGNVTVTGTGGGKGSGVGNYGIYLNAGGKITSDGSATTVSLTGTGGDSSGGTNHGIFVTGGTSPNSSTVTSGGGAVSLNGTGGGRLTSGTNFGVGVASTGQITAGGSATLSVVGSGGNLSGTGNTNTGVNVTSAGSAITSGGGAVSITGTEGGNASVAIATSSSGSATTATNGGALTLTGNSFSLAGPVSAGASGMVNLVPRSSGVALNLGLAADTRGGPIALTSAELNQITAGTINLGNATGGSLTVSAPITLPTGSDLNVISAAGGSLTPSATGTDVTVGAGKSLSLSTISSLNLAINGKVADSGYQRLVLVGDLSLAGRTLNLSGSYTPVAGDVFTIVSATNLSGTFAGLADGSEILFNGRRLVVAYSASSVTLTDPSPVVTVAPSAATVDPGTSVSFTASATGNPAPTLQWQVSTNGGVDWNDILGATASPYTFTPSGGDTGKQFRAVFTNIFGSATSAATLLTVNVARTHQELWRFANFGSYISDASAADSADPDGDGLSNLMEYALGTDPNSSGVIPAVLALNGENLEYTYTRSTAAKDNGVTYQIEWSDTLEVGSWSTETVNQQITSTQGALETLKASVPKGSTGKRFLRLKMQAVSGN
jgi:hypothetical protein